jgi:hypothetical protein
MYGFIFSKLVFLAASVGAKCDLPKPHFFFLPPWWEFMPGKLDPLMECSPTLAILDMLLRLAGFVAVISIIIAGFQHQFTMGSPEKASAARHRLYNSLIGLAIALVATAAVTFIGNQLTK